MKFFLGSVFLGFITFIELQAASVRLLNDSSYTLKAVIKGADGSFLGEALLAPQEYSNWNDTPPRMNKTQPKLGSKNVDISQTPFTVIWYCMDGSDFSISDNIATGSYIKALHGSGKKTCGQGVKQKDSQDLPSYPEKEK